MEHPVHLAKVRDVTGHLPRSLRADAQDNRDRILAVARATFAAEGLDVPIREIARRAGVGPATLYRRFPTKEALITEAFAEQMAGCAGVVEEGLRDPDPWHGFCTVVQKICLVHAQDQGFTAAFTSSFSRTMDFTAARESALRSFAELIRRAKAAGQLRQDFVLDDLVMVLMANGGIRAPSPTAAVAASRRFAALLLQALHASPATTPLPPPVRLPLLASGSLSQARRTQGI